MNLIQHVERVTLLGLGPSIYDWIRTTHDRFDTLNGEVWTINAGAALFHHDLVFDMHTEGYIDSLDPELKDRVLRRRAWMKTHDRPIVMPNVRLELPTSVAYPLAEVQEKTRSSYFAVGIAYPLALAHCCDVKTLRIFGLDFPQDQDERGRSCAEYWVGRLIEKGCQVQTSPNSHFMDGINAKSGAIYGY